MQTRLWPPSSTGDLASSEFSAAGYGDRISQVYQADSLILETLLIVLNQMSLATMGSKCVVLLISKRFSAGPLGSITSQGSAAYTISRVDHSTVDARSTCARDWPLPLRCTVSREISRGKIQLSKYLHSVA